jgi:hypothetical protein
MAKTDRMIARPTLTRVEYRSPHALHGRSRISLDPELVELAKALLGDTWEQKVRSAAEEEAGKDPGGTSISRAVAGRIARLATRELKRLSGRR